MSRPRLLDLFCGAGGAAVGYHRAGFEVVGVDIEPQPHYPFEFVQADAMQVLEVWDECSCGFSHIDAFDAIHASPPCQAYSLMNNRRPEAHPDLVAPVRDLLEATGLPWVMENVPGSPCHRNLLLCGSMFGLGVLRHRHFESSTLFMAPGHCDHRKPYVGVYGDGPRPNNTGRETNHPDGYTRAGRARSLEQAQQAMGMGWADWHGTKEAIPPAYTEWIGAQLIGATA